MQSASPVSDPPLIYVAEDDPATLELIRIVLEKAGYGVMSASTGDLFLPDLEALRPVLLLLDIRMPGQSGLDALTQVKQTEWGAAVPVLMLTGDGRLDRVVQAMQLGAADYVMKPFEPAQLLGKIRAALDAPTRELSQLPG